MQRLQQRHDTFQIWNAICECVREVVSSVSVDDIKGYLYLRCFKCLHFQNFFSVIILFFSHLANYFIIVLFL